MQARHQSPGSCSAQAGPGDVNAAWSLVAEAISAPSSVTRIARVPLVPTSIPRTGMGSLHQELTIDGAVYQTANRFHARQPRLNLLEPARPAMLLGHVAVACILGYAAPL
jgi:hypothetical protein